jgi:sarcosine oxidase, subunit beta
MAETADVIVIGAGIMGISTAYHLARRGGGKVVVLERDAVCSGSTALAGGGIRHQFSKRVGVELTKRSIVTFENFEEEYGVDPQLRQHGYLYPVHTEHQLDLFRRNVEMQRGAGADVRLLEPADVAALFPYLNAETLVGATYSPRDGYCDPHLCTTAMADRARDLGAVIKQQHEVVEIKRRGDRVQGAVTTKGEFEAPVIVIACGPWAGLVGRLARVDIPVAPRRRTKFATAPFPFERVPFEMPFIIDHHTGLSIRREGPGFLMGYNRRNEVSSFSTDAEWSLVPDMVEVAVELMPALEDAQISHGFAGLYEMTPDQDGIISAVPEVEGLHVIGGFSGHGFMHGPIAGQLMAEIIMDGQAHTVDISSLAFDRFARGEYQREILTSF